jgi:hypothetical protein
MNKKQALEQLSQLEKEALELRKIIETSEVSPEQILIDILNKGFVVKITKDYITYYQENLWIFQQDLKNKILWCNYYKVWQVFIDKYSFNYQQIEDLQTKVVGEALNCKHFILCPKYLI